MCFSGGESVCAVINLCARCAGFPQGLFYPDFCTAAFQRKRRRERQKKWERERQSEREIIEKEREIEIVREKEREKIGRASCRERV